VKIIHRGVDPKDTTHRAVCARCKTEVEFTQSEAVYHSDRREGDFLSIACPVCADTITKSVRS
jgi:uncharacterized protein with PIN domain